MEKLKGILARKMEFLSREQYSINNFDNLWVDFLVFIASTPELKDMLHKFAMENKISRFFLEEIIYIYFAHQTSLGKKDTFPEFYSKDVESKFSILKNLLKDFETKGISPMTELDNRNGDPLFNGKGRYFNIKKLYEDILEEIELTELRKNSPKKERSSPVFDSKKSILFFESKQIEISKTRDSDPHYLLCILFKDKTKSWAFDEIWEDAYFHSNNSKYDPKTDWRKIYYAGYSVNEKVEKATTNKDFLALTKTSMSINNDYLE